ncbi:MAG TPA: hypothetical protein VIX35_06970, partial [Vicinamibacterales bacterium]
DLFQLVLLLSDSAPHHPAQGTGLVFTPDGRLIVSRMGGGMTIWESRASGTVSAIPGRTINLEKHGIELREFARMDPDTAVATDRLVNHEVLASRMPTIPR